MTPVFWTLAKIKVDGVPEAFAVHREGANVHRGETLSGFRTKVAANKCPGRFPDRDAAILAEYAARAIHAEHLPAITRAKVALQDEVSRRDRSIRRQLAGAGA